MCLLRHEMDDDHDPIDQEKGMVNVYKLLPEMGDSVLIVNCGTHFEVRHQKMLPVGQLCLTDEDIDNIRQGKIVWN